MEHLLQSFGLDKFLTGDIIAMKCKMEHKDRMQRILKEIELNPQYMQIKMGVSQKDFRQWHDQMMDNFLHMHEEIMNYSGYEGYDTFKDIAGFIFNSDHTINIMYGRNIQKRIDDDRWAKFCQIAYDLCFQ